MLDANSLRFPKFIFLNKQGCCTPVTMTAYGDGLVKYQSYLGKYRAIGMAYGAPMYDKVGGRGKIMRQSDGKWIVVKGLGGVVDARSADADTAFCPTDINHWSYHTFRGRARITINCSQKSKLTFLRSKQLCLTLG